MTSAQSRIDALLLALDTARRERDEARAEVERLTRERDEARAQLAALREAATLLRASVVKSGYGHVYGLARVDAALSDPEAAARAHDARVRAGLARRALDLAAEIKLPGHDGDEESGWHDEDCQRCAIDALLAMLADEAERGGA